MGFEVTPADGRDSELLADVLGQVEGVASLVSADGA